MKVYHPHTVSSAPAESKATLDALQKGLGFLPNMFATIAESPAAVNGYVALENALAKGTLSSAERQLLHTTISSEHGCLYCTAAHSTFAGMFKADEASVAEARAEAAPSATRLGALMTFAREVIRERGQISDDVLQAFFDAGFTKAQALEVVANIGLKTISNFIDGFAHVDLDAQFEARRWEPAGAL
jgi:uncharacterized peroxidase-related enzyme